MGAGIAGAGDVPWDLLPDGDVDGTVRDADGAVPDGAVPDGAVPDGGMWVVGTAVGVPVGVTGRGDAGGDAGGGVNTESVGSWVAVGASRTRDGGVLDGIWVARAATIAAASPSMLISTGAQEI